MTSGRHSRAKNASFSVCPENPDLTFASKIFSVVFDGHFETISEQKRAISNLRLSLTFLRVETVSEQAPPPRPFLPPAKNEAVRLRFMPRQRRFMHRRCASYAERRASYLPDDLARHSFSEGG